MEKTRKTALEVAKEEDAKTKTPGTHAAVDLRRWPRVAGTGTDLKRDPMYGVFFSDELAGAFDWTTIDIFELLGRLVVLTFIVVVLFGISSMILGYISYRTDRLIFPGAVLFVISDTILAADRFKGAFKPARALNLITYFGAQWLIASSVGMLVL